MNQTLARASLALAVAFGLLLVAVHLARPDLDPTWVPVSRYAIGPWGWLMTLAFVAWGGAPALLVAALWPRIDSTAARIGLGLLAIGALGPLLAAVFPMDPLDTPAEQMTAAGMVHAGAAVLGDALPVAAVVLTAARVWTDRAALWVAAGLAVATLIAASVAMGVMLPESGQLGPDVQVGWFMRAFALASVGWVGVAARATAQGRP